MTLLTNLFKQQNVSFPKLYLHWEDFGRLNAANILEKYRKQIPTFNDDIQGTGIVTLGGIFGSLDISGEKLTDQVYLCYGGGTAGAGIASRVLREMVSEGLLKKKPINVSLWLINKVSS